MAKRLDVAHIGHVGKNIRILTHPRVGEVVVGGAFLALLVEEAYDT